MLIRLHLVVLLVKLLDGTAAHNEQATGLVNSINQIESLWRSERGFVLELKDYIDKTQKSIQVLQNYIRSFEDIRPLSGGSDTVHHPIDAHLFIRHLAIGWPIVKRTLQKVAVDSSVLDDLSSRDDREILPTQGDFELSEEALARIIGAYRLNASHVSQGILIGQHISPSKSHGELTAWELGRLAIPLLNQDLYTPAIEILDQVLQRLQRAKTGKEPPIQPVFLSESVVESDVVALKIKAIKHHDETLGNILNGQIRYYGDGVNTRPFNSRLKYNTSRLEEILDAHFEPVLFNASETELIRQQTLRLCRGHELRDGKLVSQLKCRYAKGPAAFLRLAPMRLEYMSVNPEVLVVHDLLNDEENAFIVNTATPHLKGTHGGASMSFKVADLNRTEGLTYYKKLELLTGTKMQPGKDSEISKVKNYGIGGTYGLHSDFRGIESEHGERLATVIIYLTDVHQGGVTVFPRLGVAVKPKRNAALLLWNTNLSGEMDPLTVHSGCPVIHGNKWVLTHWINSNANVLNVKCSSRVQDEHIEVL